MSLGPHAFSLRQLQYAVAVADALSFRKAAESCRVSQPSLSAQLAQLEQALGVQLFERDRRHVLVTPPGRALIPQGVPVVETTMVTGALLLEAGLFGFGLLGVAVARSRRRSTAEIPKPTLVTEG